MAPLLKVGDFSVVGILLGIASYVLLNMIIYSLLFSIITKKSSTQTIMEESCLSLMEPEIRGRVSRANRVTINTQLLTGKAKEIKASGLLARVFQHEIDHLRGKLIIDYANIFKKMEIRKKFRKK